MTTKAMVITECFYGFSDAMEMEADAQVFGSSIEDDIYDSCYTKPEEIIILG